MTLNPIQLEPWVREILVDPLSKQPMEFGEDGRLFTSYGRYYPFEGNIADLRLLAHETTPDQRLWREGQVEYERWSERLVAMDGEQDYQSEMDGVREIYSSLPLDGSILDVGGHQGRLRAFLRAGQPYVSCDPFKDVFRDLEQQPKLLDAYPFLTEPVNFVCCDAEFLPFANASFDTVHMRSVLDHFYCPELAIIEAHRVLSADGNLIVGLFIPTGKSNTLSMELRLKEAVRAVLVRLGMRKYADHHLWHPTFTDLVGLIEKCGFEVKDVLWQPASNERVCYLRAGKRLPVRRAHKLMNEGAQRKESPQFTSTSCA